MEVPELYHASVETFYSVVEGMDDKYSSIAVFSHNPGITYLVNSFGVARVDDMPTCAVFGVHATTENWKDFQKADKQFWLFDYPKLGV